MTRRTFWRGMILLIAFSIALPLVQAAPMIEQGIQPADVPASPGVDAAPEYLPPQTDADVSMVAPAKRWIIQLEDPPVAQYTGGIAGLEATAASVTAAHRLDVNARESKAYIAYLEAEQVKFAAAVLEAMPGAHVERDYQVVFNGVAVTLPEANERADRWLSRLPGVKAVFREKVYRVDMYSSLPLIDAPALWAQVGGQSEAGEGVKIASIDTGIHPFNDCFDTTGYTYPAGYPKFDADKPYATTGKVIAARAYFRADDPPLAGDGGTWPGPNGSSHGTHTSGTMACVPGTVAETAGYTETISGVAPAAYLMSYKVFYPSAGEFSGSAFDAELIAAIEDAVVDGADVVNNSWGEHSSSAFPSALDLAFDAAWDAGMVVVFSAGNSGPYPGTVDHPSDKNILVGASTTSGTIAAGILSVSAPEPVSDTLQNMAFTTAMFGEALPSGYLYTYPFVSAQVISPTNFEGCDPWPAGTFTDKAALISRGACDFSQKVYNAQEGGADFVVIHNHALGGDTLINMGPGVDAASVTIPSVFIMQTPGLAMSAWYATYAEASEIEFDFMGYQVGNIRDRLASFTSRGPSIRRMIDPDLVAPGVNIFSAGYGSGSGEAEHTGFGQASGTSMAAPHVTGSAAVLKQLHPDWTPAQIKSALMNTANINLADYDGSEVGILDYGAGRIDLGHAGDPGLTFDNPSVSFGEIYADDSDAVTVVATDVFSRAAGTSLTYALTVSETGNITTTSYFTLSVNPASLTFDDDGDAASFDVTMEIAAGAPAGDYEGFVWLRHGSHELHLPVWVQVWPALGDNPVLLLDNDAQWGGFPDYTSYYTETLEALGVGYDHYSLPYGNPNFPDISVLQQYEAIIWYTGDQYNPDGSYTVPTPPTEWDQNILMEYLRSGGRLLATGQDLASAVGATGDAPTGLYNSFLGADYEQDNVYDGTSPLTRTVAGLSWANDVLLDLSSGAGGDGANNQGWVDEVSVYGAPPSPDVRPVPAKPFLMASQGTHLADGHVGLTRASEPTLEEPARLFDGRTAYLSFGFEGVNNPPPGTATFFSSRDNLMSGLLTFLWTEPVVSLPDVTAIESGMATLVAQAGSVLTTTFHTADIVQYRWDYGDGSAFEITTVPTTTHVYAAGGTYSARVEVTDEYGHTALASSAVAVSYKLYLPVILNN